MNRNAFSYLSSKEFLGKVWREMFLSTSSTKRHSYGIDFQSLHDFNNDRITNLRTISELLKSGQYSPSFLVPYFIPKPNKKERVICVPTVRDRLIQRSVLFYLNDKGYTLNNPISYGFIKGKGNAVKEAGKTAVHYRSKNSWVYKADISAFFDKMNRDSIKEIVREKVRAKSLHKLFDTFIDTEIHCSSNLISTKIRSKGIIQGCGVRQGMPISPYLANLYLSDFDKKILKKNIPMVRYADDIIAFASSESECYDIHNFCVSELAKLSLTVHDISSGSKTEIYNPDATVDFLGLGLSKKRGDGYEIIVTQGQLSAIKTNIMNFANLDYCIKNKTTLSTMLKKIDSKIAGYVAAYDECSNREELANALRDFRALTLARLLSFNFQIDISKLTNKQKKFLEIVE